MKKISILGSTGSVGQSTIKVLQAQKQNFDIQVLTANTNVSLLAEQAKQLNAKHAVIADEALFGELKTALAGTDIKVNAGEEALIEAAGIPADWIMAAIVGMSGLKPLMKAIGQRTTVAIANKEPLVAAGDLVIETAKQAGTTLLPIDSEHNAIFQVFDKNNAQSIEKIILTASGGPFRTTPLEELGSVTPEQALAHPNWSMGKKISIDSATMMNKALEVIEAHRLFDIEPDKIEVVIHPQSVVHSMVEYCDGSVLSQMGAANMCTPITYALGWPERLPSPGQKLDVQKLSRLDFAPMDHERFPALNLAYQCMEAGSYAEIALNAANEVAVEAFLGHKIAFLDIYDVVSGILEDIAPQKPKTLDDILVYDSFVRGETESYILNMNSRASAAL